MENMACRGNCNEIGSKIIYELKANKNRFLADPNIFIHKNEKYILAEDCSLKTQKAHISCFKIDPNNRKAVRLGIAIKEKFHLSFPYTFEYKGDSFMSVESGEDESISVYKCEGNPLCWDCIYRFVPFKNSKPADPLIWFQNDYWWLCFSMIMKCTYFILLDPT